MNQVKFDIGLIFTTGYQFAREIIEGASEFSYQDIRINLHILSEDGGIPAPSELPCPLDGVIAFNPTRDIPKLEKLAEHFICCSSRDKPEGADFVVNDDAETGRMAADYYIRRGYRDLVYVGFHGLYHSDQRYQGFLERATDSQIKVERFELFTNEDLIVIPEKLHNLPSRCGVCAANDHMARSLMNAIDQPVSKIPLLYAVLGVDNDLLQRVRCQVPLSSIELDGKGIGFAALQRLIARIEDPSIKDKVTKIPPLRMITRQSTDLFALEDDLAARTLRFMDEHLADIHDVGDLVAKMGTPRRTLELRFRNATGRTLARELAVLRVERARDYLRNTDFDSGTIAQKVGLPESRMLWLLFKRLTGETPSAYRKRMPLVG